ERVVIPVPWRSEDCPEHYWNLQGNSTKQYCPFECMIFLGSTAHRERTQLWDSIRYKLIDLCRVKSQTWPSTDEGKIMDYTVGSEFLFECFDRTDSADAASENQIGRASCRERVQI